MPKGAKRAELSAEQRSEIARLIAEIDRVQEETASAAEQSRIELEEERRLEREEDRRQAELEEQVLRHHQELRARAAALLD